MKFYTRLLCYGLTVVFFANSLPAMANVTNLSDKEDALSSEHFQLLERHLEAAETHSDLDMNEATFELKLDEQINNIQVKIQERIGKMSEKQAERRFQRNRKSIVKSGREDLRQEVDALNASNLTAKEKLASLNSLGNMDALKSNLMAEVKEGGLKNFIKKLKNKIKNRKANLTPSDKDYFKHQVLEWVLSVVAFIIIGLVFGPEVLVALVIIDWIIAGIFILLILGVAVGIFIYWKKHTSVAPMNLISDEVLV